MINLRLTIVALAALAAGIAAGLLLLNPSAPQTAGEVGQKGKPLVGGAFSLTDQTGKRVTDQDFRGRHMLVFFGFTYCPDICPSGLQVISAALDELGPAANAIKPVFITIDPERDTVEKLKAYMSSFHPSFTALTGTPAEIAAVTKAYRVYVKKVPGDRTPADYTLDHSSIVYLMGPSGAMIGFESDLSKPSILAGQIKKALAVKE